MKKSVTRQYTLSLTDVRQAIYLYLKVHNDQPMPDSPQNMQVQFSDDWSALVSISEDLTV